LFYGLWRAGITQYSLEGDWAGGRWEAFRDHAYINFTGYDYIGFTIYPKWISTGNTATQSPKGLQRVAQGGHRLRADLR
jgi:hypothetical protein